MFITFNSDKRLIPQVYICILICYNFSGLLNLAHSSIRKLRANMFAPANLHNEGAQDAGTFVYETDDVTPTLFVRLRNDTQSSSSSSSPTAAARRSVQLARGRRTRRAANRHHPRHVGACGKVHEYIVTMDFFRSTQ